MVFFTGGFVGDTGSGLGQQLTTNRITTTDDTATNILQIALAEGQTLTIKVILTGRRTDAGGVGVSASYELSGSFKRDLGGNVTQIGHTLIPAAHYDASSAWNGTLNANTTAQSVDVRVVGEVGATINWTARANYTILAA